MIHDTAKDCSQLALQLHSSTCSACGHVALMSSGLLGLSSFLLVNSALSLAYTKQELYLLQAGVERVQGPILAVYRGAHS